MKTKSPLISVIMPAYNVEKYVDQAIASILNQTHKSLELIIINDCSTDKTGALAEQCAKKDQRVRVIHNQTNSKEWFCRNMGIEEATGDYIAWMDADDISQPTRLEKQLQFLNNNPDVGMVGTFFKLINEGNKEIKDHGHLIFFGKMLVYPYTNDHGLKIATIAASHLFRRSVLSRFKKKYYRPLIVGMDTDFLLRAVDKNILIYNLPEPLYYYRLHKSQASSKKNLNRMFLITSLACYAADHRRVFGVDPLDDIIKKYKIIDEKNIIPALIRMLKIKKLSHHEYFLSHWLSHEFVFNIGNIKLFFVALFYYPRLVFFSIWVDVWRNGYHAMIKIYLRLTWLHKPWRAFKKIAMLRNK